MCVVVLPVPAAELSPKFHEYDATVPSGSDDVDPSNDPTRPLDEDVNAATGGWFAAATVIGCDTVFVAPLLSVTVNATVYVPAAAYVCVVVLPVPAAELSPKFHEYDATVPSGSDDVDPSNDATRPVDDDVNAATGGWLAFTAAGEAL